MPKFRDAIEIFEARVAGIPCQIAVTAHEEYVPARTWGPPEDCYPAEGGFSEYRILDRNGYLAEWLERKAYDLDLDDEIQDLILAHIEKCREKNERDFYDGPEW
jgi:hypothetical protein